MRRVRKRALSVVLRVFAPFLPFVTEEIWSWWREGSIHRQPWPTAAELEQYIEGQDESGALALERASLVLGEVRRTKSEAKRPLTTPVVALAVRDTAANLEALRAGETDLRAAGFIEAMELAAGDALEVRVSLAEPA